VHLSNLELPKRGPFQVSGGFAPKLLIGWGLLALFVAGFAFLMIWLGNDMRSRVGKIKKIWSAGTTYKGESGYEGYVLTQRLIAKSYSLDLTYEPPGYKPLKVPISFVRFGSGPDDGDAYEVHYIADDPYRAVMSWQYEALGHMQGLMIGAYLLALLGLYAAFRVLRYVLRRVGAIHQLARRGKIIAVPVANMRTINDAWAEITLVVAGGKSVKQRYRPKALPLHFTPANEVVVLSSMDGRDVQLLATNGYPLNLPLD